MSAERAAGLTCGVRRMLSSRTKPELELYLMYFPSMWCSRWKRGFPGLSVSSMMHICMMSTWWEGRAQEELASAQAHILLPSLTSALSQALLKAPRVHSPPLPFRIKTLSLSLVRYTGRMHHIGMTLPSFPCS